MLNAASLDRSIDPRSAAVRFPAVSTSPATQVHQVALPVSFRAITPRVVDPRVAEFAGFTL